MPGKDGGAGATDRRGDSAAPAPGAQSPGAPNAPGARRLGIGCGLGAGIAVALIAGAVLDLWEASGFEAIPEFGAVGGLLLLGGWGLRAWAAKCDRVNQLRQSAPALPLRLAAAGEPVWIEGRVVCPHPIVAPHFGVRCAWLHVRIVRGSGKSKKTERDEKQAARTWIEADGMQIELDLASAAFHQLPRWSQRDGSRTVTVAALAVGAHAGVCGRVREEPRAAADWSGSGAPGRDLADVTDLPAPAATDADSDGTGGGLFESGAGAEGDAPGLVLGPLGDVPLLVTPLARDAWCTHVETEEMGFRWAGAALGSVGAALLALGAGTAVGACRPDDFGALLAGAVVGALATCVVLLRAAAARIAASRRLAEEAAAALESDLAGATTDRDAAAARVEARMRIYDFFAAEHNRMLDEGLGRFVARRRGLTPLPIRGA